MTAHAEEAIVGGQHHAVEVDHLRVLVVGKDVVERYVLYNMGVLKGCKRS